MKENRSLESFIDRARLRPVVQIAYDFSSWVVAVPLASLLRFVTSDTVNWPLAWLIGGLVAGAYVVLSLTTGSYRRRFRYGSSEDLTRLVCFSLFIGVGLGLVKRSDLGEDMRYSVPALAPTFAIAFMLWPRLLWRRIHGRRREKIRTTAVVVVGAGDAGHAAVRLMVDDPTSPYRPVALVDDDPLKSKLRVHGVAVAGTIAELPDVVRRHGASAVVAAIPSASHELMVSIRNLTWAAGVPLYVLPPVAQLFATVSLEDFRPLRNEDLLGRPDSEIDPAILGSFIRGKRVLVTGAGGSIGSELCRQIADLGPATMVMLDRDESLLADLQLSLEGRALLEDPNLVLADIRDAGRMKEVFDHFRPEVVFHSAALKHLSLLERFPSEAWLTNVLGTVNVLTAARDADVSTFVNISTDKAADPSSVLGSSKRLTERLTAHFAEETGRNYVSVRFGNVLGSRGSVLTIFRKQADLGLPITVTDPEVTRFFMTDSEAARLTVVAGAIGEPGELLVLDMGEPVKIVDIAHRFARQHQPELEVVVTGLRPGEKLHEILFGHLEKGRRSVHPLVSHVTVPPLALSRVLSSVENPRGVNAEDLQRMASAPC